VQHKFGRGEDVDEPRAPYERDAQREQGAGRVAEENLRLRQELLEIRDNLIGHEARLGEALGRIELLESELCRYQDAMADAERLLSTRTGRLLRAWHRLRALIRA
jgi:chromosome segregation ATPase